MSSEYLIKREAQLRLDADQPQTVLIANRSEDTSFVIVKVKGDRALSLVITD